MPARFFRLLLAPLVFTSTRAFGAESPPAGTFEFFESKIRPVLVTECVECHGAGKQKGGLRVDFRDGLRKGGETAPAVVPGEPAKSLLLSAIKHLDADLKMPAKAPKLDESVIADFEKWIASGGADPRDEPPKSNLTEGGAKPGWEQLLAARRGWWSLQPIGNPAPPPVKNGAWSEHPIDRFLLAKMEEQGLAPAANADARTLIRRLTFLLTGLPPTPEEVKAFAGESVSNPQGAIDHATTRLLASPRFGEHWARHWMDLFRYADTHGSEGDPALPEAWRYRDYLIRAFNADVPLDELIREHLAGDLLKTPRWNREEQFNESILGTAQLRMVEHGYQPVDTLDEQNKVVDNQIDVVMKAFQGLTVTCARCHDHKFDAISQRDYYALYGVFASCRPAMVAIDAPERLRKNVAELTSLKAQIKDALAAAWLAEATKFPARLLEHDARVASATRLRDDIARLEREAAAIESGVRQRLIAQRGAGSTATLPMPIARWAFEDDARDTLGIAPGHFEGGAIVRNGRLLVNGTDAFVRTDPLPREVTEKTLEAWVSPANLTQKGGGVISLENSRSEIFDAIVFAEKDAGQWMAGSDFYRRGKSLGAARETAAPGQLVHLAAVYQVDGRVALFRNGAPYGQEYLPNGDGSTLQRYAAADSRLVFGIRHTSAANGYFAGEIEEARLYDRALTPVEIAASFRAGFASIGISEEDLASAWTGDERARRVVLTAELTRRRTAHAQYAIDDALTPALAAAATDSRNQLHAWVNQRAPSPVISSEVERPLTLFTAKAAGGGARGWDFANGDLRRLFAHGIGLTAAPAGEWAVLPEGPAILTTLRPAAAITDALSRKHHGVLATPRFKVESGFISVRAWGGGGAQVRLIVDGYPIGMGGIFPTARLEKDEPTSIRLDVKYRRGSMAYLEFATASALTRPETPSANDRSWFGVERIVFHDSEKMPEDAPLARPLSPGVAPRLAAELAREYGKTLADAIAAWRSGGLNETQRSILDEFVRQRLLPTRVDALPGLSALVAEYRRLENDIPAPRHAPGVFEADSYDAPLLVRGEHTKPAELVPRAFLAVLNPVPFFPAQASAVSSLPIPSPSGRRELADALTNEHNPLTARVLANRLWHWIYGRGIVATPDNFGRMGEKPTHPEMLDALATHLVEHRWSAKEFIRFLVTARTFSLSSESSPEARTRDPGNLLLSRAPVRRLEAESIRDALLAVSGRLDPLMFGPGLDVRALVNQQRRRSVYFAVRRANLSPFLEVFDAPKPFSTLGRRDVTNVPAQSLTLLNDPFAIELAHAWSEAELTRPAPDAAARVRAMFERALARLPSEDELTASLAYLEQHPTAAGLLPQQLLGERRLWQDFAQSLFNLKEFIYLR